MRRAAIMLAGVVGAGVLGTGLARGVEIKLGAIHDATIFNDPSLAMGTAPKLFVGTAGDSTIRRALVRFDLSSIPQGSTILSAQLSMTISDARGSVTADIHRVISDWNEGPAGAVGFGDGRGTPAGPNDVTWLRTGLGGSWSTSGGDFDPVASDTVVMPTGGIVSFDVTTDVQLLNTGHAPDFGWILIAQNEGVDRNVRGFFAHEGAGGPTLTVTLVPAPAGAGLLVGAGLLATRRRRTTTL